MKITHEQFILAVRDVVADALEDKALADRISHAKMVYGIGDGSYRGICYYAAWKNGQPAPVDLVEIAASGEESPVQLAGTTIHELGHVLAKGAGHGAEWKRMCAVLGLHCIQAAGTRYTLAMFAPAIRAKIARLGQFKDGKPIFGSRQGTGLPPANIRPCQMGQGTRGGKSRGPGSGSRQRLYTLKHECEGQPTRIRMASDTAQIECSICHQQFERAEK